MYRVVDLNFKYLCI